MAKNNNNQIPVPNVFNTPGIFVLPSTTQGSNKTPTLTATLMSNGKALSILATAAEGNLNLNVSDEQDFNGNSHITVFGKSVHQFTVSCMEHTDCTKQTSSSNLAAIAAQMKGAVNAGTLPFITLQYNNKALSISGYVYQIGCKFDPPFRYFTLYIQGTFE